MKNLVLLISMLAFAAVSDTDSDCGGSFMIERGQFPSPNLTVLEESNTSCSWSVRVETGYAIELVFIRPFVKMGPNDTVQVFDVLPNGTMVSREEWKGSKDAPSPIVSTTSALSVKFTTNGSLNGTGFSAKLSTIKFPCGGNYMKDSGSVESPRYPLYHSCRITIQVEEGSAIQLKYKSEKDAATRGKYLGFVGIDIVRIFDVLQDGRRLMRDHWSAYMDPPDTVSKTSRIDFDFSPNWDLNGPGFTITWLKVEPECGGYLAKDSGELHSPNYPVAVYDNNLKCNWTIMVEDGYVVRLEINDTLFDIMHFGVQDPCAEDRLEIFDVLPSGKRHSREFYCGKMASPTVIVSLSSVVDVVFKSDSFFQGKGFSMTWTKQAKPSHTVLEDVEGEATSPNYPSGYPDNAMARLEIRVVSSSFILLTFDRFDLGSDVGTSCQHDKIEIFDVFPNNSLLSLGEWCGSRAPPQIRSAGSRMFIDLNTDAYHDNNGQGFSASWKSDLAWDVTLTTDKGLITSANFPSPFGTEQTWTWRIHVTDGFLIALTFLPVFDLGCNLRRESLRVLDIEPDGKRNVSGIWCSKPPQHWVSASSKIDLEFVTDKVGSNKGFAVVWSKVGFKELEEKNCNYCCATGFILWGKQCVDIDECVYANGGCDHMCTNTLGSWNCSCEHGYNKNGSECTIQECGGVLDSTRGTVLQPNYTFHYGNNKLCKWTINVGNKKAVALKFSPILTPENDCIKDTVQAFEILPGGERKPIGSWCGGTLPLDVTLGSSTVDLEIQTNSSSDLSGFSFSWSQVEMESCMDSDGTCSCKEGYKQTEDNKCIDIDECFQDNGGCGHLCTNTPGGYKCSCYKGFKLEDDGKDCVDIVECNNKNAGCPHFCQNTVGSYHCTCLPGYEKKGDACEDYDECAGGRGDCQHICTNLPGSRECSCFPGFYLDKGYCIDKKRCEINNGGCEHLCEFKFLQVQCSCFEGFKKNGNRCTALSTAEKLKGEAKSELTSPVGLTTESDKNTNSVEVSSPSTTKKSSPDGGHSLFSFSPTCFFLSLICFLLF